MGHQATSRDRLITTTDAARILGVNPAAVVAWANSGRFPAILCAASGQPFRYRFAREDIVAFRRRTLARARIVSRSRP